MSSKAEWLAVHARCVAEGISAAEIMAVIDEIIAKRNAN